MHSYRKGFTLIELLVVIAIIGILSTIIIAFVGSSRGRAKNGALRSSLVQIPPLAELYFLKWGTYEGMKIGSYAAVITDDSVRIAYENALAYANLSGHPKFFSNKTGWVIVVELILGEGSIEYFCVDSDGSAKGESVANYQSITSANSRCS